MSAHDVFQGFGASRLVPRYDESYRKRLRANEVEQRVIDLWAIARQSPS
jgi:hypothetical protein